MTELAHAFSKESLIKGASLVGGVIVGGFVASFLPSFSYSGVIYSIVGALIVIGGIGFDGSGVAGYGAMFAVGIGAAWAANIVSAFSGLLKQ